MTEALNENHRGLKAVVIILGILIFVMVGVIVATILSRASQMGEDEPGLNAFGEVDVPLPGGASVIESLADGGRLMLRVRDGRGAEFIVVVDAASGEHLGTLRLAPSDNRAANEAATSP